MNSMIEILTEKRIDEFIAWLHSEERSQGTVEKYVRDIKALRGWLNGLAITKERVAAWKNSLINAGYKPTTINSMLASINTYCRFAGIECRIRFLRIQRRVFRDEDKELTKREYQKLVETARNNGNERLALILETIGGTGIRVSETQYITVESAVTGKSQIMLKGKIREIMLPRQLCRKLLQYAKKQKIASGAIFITKTGRALSRKQIWAEMKSLCRDADVSETKVFPHNLRHLFARVFYRLTHDIVQLSDLLGHSSVDTTRLYLLASGVEHAQQLEKLGLIL